MIRRHVDYYFFILPCERDRKLRRNVGIFIAIYTERSVARGQSAAASRYRPLVADQTNASSTSYCLFQLRPGRDVLKRHARPRLGSPFYQPTTQVISPKLIVDYSLGDVSTQHSAPFFSVHILSPNPLGAERGHLLEDGVVNKSSVTDFQKT